MSISDTAPLLVGLGPWEIRDRLRDGIEAALKAASEVPYVGPEDET